MVRSIEQKLITNKLVTMLSDDRSIVFIDSKVDDYQILATGVIPGTEVFILDADKDGITQIGQVLSQKPQLSTVHIVSHGSPGCLYLGNTQLSLDTLDEYAEKLRSWFDLPARSRTPLDKGGRGELLLYSCNVAAGDAGEEFIAKLHNITGAEIAASTTLTGNPNKGGNWNLEYKTTEIATPQPFTEEIKHSYSGILAVTTSGTVFIDYNNDGTRQASNDAAEIAYEGITIIAYDANNNIISQTTTDSSGNYSLDTPDSTPLRIEFGNLPSGFVGSSIAGTNSVSDILFIDGTSNVTANFGIHRPSDVTTGNSSDIDLITVCYVEGIGSGSASAIIIHNYDDAGSPASTPTAPSYTVRATFDKIGTVNGLAYHRESSTLFAGSFYKRHSALLGTIDFTSDGDASASTNDGSGAAYTSTIYSIDNAGNVTEFARLDDVVDPRGAIDGSTYDWDTDSNAFDAVGKTGLGDVELSEDAQTLWSINLNDNKLYKLPVGDSSAPLTPTAPATGNIESFDFITDIINSGDDLGVNPQQNIRPFALAVRDGLVYIGMVNTAQYDANGNEGNTTSDDLKAFVYTFDPDNPTAVPTQVLDIPLDYERDHVVYDGSSTVISGNWNPWTDTFPSGLTTLFSANEAAYPQPIFSDIDFDPDGNMLLGFRDRWGDQVGYQVPDPSGNSSYSADAAGDMLQAVYDDVSGTWTIETHVTTDGINGNNDPDGEFFGNEFLEEGAPNDSSATHAETGQGGLTVVPGFTEVVTTALDPTRAFTGGFEWFNTTDGDYAGHFVTEDPFFDTFTTGTITASGLELFISRDPDGGGIDANTFAKANGLGDLEFIAAAATLEIGDRIWFDTDQDGIQDVGEANVTDGVTVELYASGGSTALQTTTTTNGNYYFAGLDPLTDYEVRLVASDLNGGLLDGYQATLQNSGSDDALDSDAADSSGVPTIFLTTGVSGENDHTYDIGLTSATTYDYGDAPDASASTGTGNYQTTDSDGGAKHILGSGLTIGSGVTADDGTLQNVGATADTDDGVTFTETLETTDSSFSVSVDVNLAGSGSGTISATDDFSSGGYTGGTGWLGDWTEVGESNGAGTVDVEVQGGILHIQDDPASIYRQVDLSSATGDATLTFNYSQNSLDNANEGYDIVVSDSLGGNETTVFTIDNSTTASTAAGESASETIPQSYLTSTTTITIRTRGIVNQGNGDDAYIDNINISAPVSVETPATLAGWIDFNQDGAFNANEAVSQSVTSSGTETLTWNSFPSITDGTTYARFRLSSASALDTIEDGDSVGELSDGEVEDYQIIIGRDYGDAIDTGAGTGTGNYQTTSSDSGASHGILNGLSIGSTVDADSGSLQDVDASNDDTDGDDDEDGVTFTSTLSPSDTSYSVSVDVTNTTGSNATLVGWIDFDQDGSFESTEAVSTTFSSSGTQNLIWDTSSITINTGTTYARFRLSSDSALDTIDNSDSIGALSDGEVEDYVLNVGLDYGDAPDTTASEATGDYQTTVDNGGPSHIIDSNLKIGSLTDADSGALQNDDADADDTDNSDDEDGVTFASSLDINTTSYSTTVTVTNNTGSAATLVGWVDFDQDGVFESAEAVVANVPNGNTDASVTLTWDDDGSTSTGNLVGNGDLPGYGALSAETLATGTTYARFRLTTDSNFDGNDALGAANDGEVEDYKLTVNLDYGDARDTGVGTGTSNFNTTAEDNGASHIIVNNLTIGSTVDADDGTLQNADADADDNDGTDDETGISSFSTLQTDDDSYNLDVAVNNSTGSAATLIGWIDFDQSGTFDSDEAVSASVPNGTTTASPINLNWSTLPTDITDGITYARFRLSTDSNLTTSFATGQLNDGEVEDYKIDIEGVDYGDAPDAAASTGTGNYQTTQDDGGASHIIVSGLKIGATVDAENGTLQNTAADADDLDNNNDDDDEDGITFNSTLDTTSLPGSFVVDVDYTNDTVSSADIIGWIDFDQSGTFDSDEAASTNVSSSVFDQSTTLTWTSFPGIVSGPTYARFRISNDTATLDDSYSTGALSSGEVEDYQITIEGGSDYGDASTGSDSYLATTTSHSIAAGLSLGSIVDSETSPTANSNADADDTTGQDDEDGVTFDSVLTSSNTTYSVTVDAVNTTGSDAELIGWIDFDGDGTFQSDEASEVVTVSASGEITLDWTSIPSGTQVGDTYARFRLNNNTTNLDTNTPTGTLDGGEVEDYLINIKNDVSGTGSSEVINSSSSDPTTTGDDFITGGAGQDTITGGAGDDCFHFNRTSDGVDVITDFNDSGVDRIDLSDFFDTNGELEGITNPFGTYVETVVGASGTMVQIDFDPADSLPNKDIVYLQGYTTPMTAADFIF